MTTTKTEQEIFKKIRNEALIDDVESGNPPEIQKQIRDVFSEYEHLFKSAIHEAYEAGLDKYKKLPLWDESVEYVKSQTAQEIFAELEQESIAYMGVDNLKVALELSAYQYEALKAKYLKGEMK